MALFINFLSLLLEAAPWLVLGLFLGGLIKALIPVEFLHQHLRGSSLINISKAALLGAPLPLCSCGVIPVALGLREAGASKSATTAFLVATPETGIDSLSISYALLGPFLAVFRVVAALFSALMAGLLVLFFDPEKPPALVIADATLDATIDSQQVHAACCAQATPASQAQLSDAKSQSDCCAPNGAPQKWHIKAWQGIHYAFGQLLNDIVWWLLAGLFFAALANTFLAPSFFLQWGQGLLAMLVIMLAGIPMYICATASTPVAASLIVAGVSPGVALVLMLTGPATNVSTLGVLQAQLGTKTMCLYLIGVCTSAVLSGLSVDYLIHLFNLDIQTQIVAHGHNVQVVQWAALLLLATLVIGRKIYKP